MKLPIRYHEIYEVLHKLPFEPFRIQLTNGQSLVIQHPDFAGLPRTSLLVFVSSEKDDVPDRFNQYDLLHIVGIEPADGAKPKRRRGDGKTRG